jgi:hypothetical protein
LHDVLLSRFGIYQPFGIKNGRLKLSPAADPNFPDHDIAAVSENFLNLLNIFRQADFQRFGMNRLPDFSVMSWQVISFSFFSEEFYGSDLLPT